MLDFNKTESYMLCKMVNNPGVETWADSVWVR